MEPAEKKSRVALTSAALILANLLPLYGVLLLDWPVVALLLLFWLENIVIGVFNLLRIFFARPGDAFMLPRKLMLGGFFTVHYGAFAAGHLVFILALFGSESDAPSGGFPTPSLIVAIVTAYGLGLAVAALVLSHGISFFVNYLGEGEFRKASIASLMSRPYGRVVILHIVILVGGGVSMLLGEPRIALVLLVALKIAVDLAGHRWDHGKLSRADAAIEALRRGSRPGANTSGRT
ncbi:MAG TPA: DUF6498-containing protein [Gammaproteobacteria bacterium]